MYAPTLIALRPLAKDQERDDRATIAVCATAMATTISTLYYLARWGFDNPVRPILATLGLSLFVIVTPFVVGPLLARGHYTEPEPWWRTQPALTLAALGLTALAGMLVPGTGWNVIVVLGAVGVASSLVALVGYMSQGGMGTNLLFLTGVAVFATWAAGVAWSTPCKTPVFLETPECTAHVADPDVLSFSSLGQSVILIPLFFSAILLLALELRKSQGHYSGNSARPLRCDYGAWLFLVFGTIGVIPTWGLDAMGVGSLRTMISGSYLIGIPVFLLVLATAVAYWRQKLSSARPGNIAFLVIFAPAMVIMMGVLSIPLMIVLLATGIVLLILGRLYRDRWITACAGLCVAASAVTYKFLVITSENSAVAPLAYTRFSGPNTEWWPYLILISLFWSWLYIYVRLREENLNDLGSIRHAALEGRITDVIVMATVAVAGFLPVELAETRGGSDIYLPDVQRWLAIALLMAAAPRWLVRLREKNQERVGESRGFGRTRLSHIWLAALIIPISLTIILNVIRGPATAFRANVALRRALYIQAGVVGPVSLRSLADSATLATGLRRSRAP